MRGKPTSCVTPSMVTRITPADAGKTLKLRPSRQKSGDHPRGCGENPTPKPARLRNLGSPPRMRGKPRSIFGNRHTDRITPADAGKTRWNSSKTLIREDHPRGCGENDGKWGPKSQAGGSPPRMRGKRQHFLKLQREQRITPAHAGKTLLCKR